MIRNPARCEYCGEIVSRSLERGDDTDPIDEDAQSATARFFHTGCHEAFEKRYVTPRHRGPLRAEEEPQP